MIQEAIYRLSKKENLPAEILRDSFIEIIEGKASEAQIAGFLMGLAMKGESEEEILTTVELFRDYAIKINSPNGAIDIVGTGGDRLGTFNVSTATSFVVAGAGVPVAKHGNRSASSQCGSIDVLEELEVKVDMTPEQAEKCLFECGLTVLFAPLYHPAMKRVVPVRKELKIRTIFNIIGPMLNPAMVKRQLIGVFSKDYMETIAKVLMKLGSEQIIVVHSEEGLDEISISGKTFLVTAKDGNLYSTTITPENLGLKRSFIDNVKGGDRKENAKIIIDLLKGKKGAPRDMVLMNSAVALLIAGKVKDFKEGIELATESIDSGRAYKKLEELKRLSNLN
ncbi:MAG: anthranilate phosphoribosyltransferase [Thermodesulfovibrio sp.]|uniref:anthranilate phosphoribosyltransferase n=1 Tax=unclassified Thermodesulfovibrio TaxID=2645936 RepID=UPI00083B52A7|nr:MULTISPECIES: anthranilate phosphoribosyltransferase [unclassified Thermodesulfovibrio]MDI1470954.1 anthranilate phosphoribosyltransferase [Thermodesulfovibrio sp. 1176]MDI6713804.1 anthranilate phosphoribosyltransferase [Thermodesulfovibrio sp.]ODA43633.1 Anthranilate phosphoribosyltransferase [Thermodesulfovibrio sp. N1]